MEGGSVGCEEVGRGIREEQGEVFERYSEGREREGLDVSLREVGTVKDEGGAGVLVVCGSGQLKVSKKSVFSACTFWRTRRKIRQ